MNLSNLDKFSIEFFDKNKPGLTVQKSVWLQGQKNSHLIWRLESFCASGKFSLISMISTIKRHAQMHRFPDGLESFPMVWKVSRWSGNFPYGLETLTFDFLGLCMTDGTGTENTGAQTDSQCSTPQSRLQIYWHVILLINLVIFKVCLLSRWVALLSLNFIYVFGATIFNA